MLKKLSWSMKLTDAERRIIDPSLNDGLRYLRVQTDSRYQAKLVVALYAWAVHLAFSPHVRQLNEYDLKEFMALTASSAINKHAGEQHNAYVKWLMANARSGDGLLAHRLLQKAFAFPFIKMLERIWVMPTLEDNLRPNTLKRVFEDWSTNPEYLNNCVDFDGLYSQIDDLCVACSVAAANVYGLTTGRYIHRSVVPQAPSDLPASCDVFISYAAEDRPVAQALAEALTAGGKATWFDQSITPQGRFDREINTYLDEAQLVVVLWSRWSQNSHWVRGEALRALDQEKLISAILDGVTPPVPFNAIQGSALRRDGESHGDSVSDLAQRVVAAASAADPPRYN